MSDDQVHVNESPNLPGSDAEMIGTEQEADHDVVETVDVEVLPAEVTSVEVENVLLAEPMRHNEGELNETSTEIIKEKEAKPEIPNGVVARILRLDHEIASKEYRLQRDSLRAINASISLFIKLLTKTCEVVQTTSSSAGPTGGKRLTNTLDIDHLGKAIKRYEVLGFLSDLVAEMNERVKEPTSLGSLESVLLEVDNNETVESAVNSKRKPDVEDTDDGVSKKQRSITSFFTRT